MLNYSTEKNSFKMAKILRIKKRLWCTSKVEYLTNFKFPAQTTNSNLTTFRRLPVDYYRFHLFILFYFCFCCLLSITIFSQINCAILPSGSSLHYLANPHYKSAAKPFLNENKSSQSFSIIQGQLLGTNDLALVPAAIQTTIAKSRKFLKRDIEQEQNGLNGNEMSRTPTTTPMMIMTSSCQQDSDCHGMTTTLNTTTTSSINSSQNNGVNNSTMQLQQAKCIKSKCQNQNLTDNQEIENNNNNNNGMKNRPKPNLRMLPIMIIMGVMFVGMCVALNMFSRARFGNKRSIFSNPHILQHKSKTNRSRRVKDSSEYRQQQQQNKARIKAKLTENNREQSNSGESNGENEDCIECIDQIRPTRLNNLDSVPDKMLQQQLQQNDNNNIIINDDVRMMEPSCSSNTAK